MKLSKELKELISKWRKILKLEDWDIEVELAGDKQYKKLEKVLGIDPGTTRGMNSSTEERQHSSIFLNNKSDKELELYLVHELNHCILNESDDFICALIEMVGKNEDQKSVFRVRHKEILEKIVWKFTRIVLELDKK